MHNQQTLLCCPPLGWISTFQRLRGGCFPVLRTCFCTVWSACFGWLVECSDGLKDTFWQYTDQPPEFYGQECSLLNNSPLSNSSRTLVAPKNTTLEMNQLRIHIPCLQKLIVRNCSVTHLESLNISDCPELNCILFEENALSCKSPLSPTMTVRSCRNLEVLTCACGSCPLFSSFSVFGEFYPIEWHSDCGKLRSITIGVIKDPQRPRGDRICFSNCCYFCLDSRCFG